MQSIMCFLLFIFIWWLCYVLLASSLRAKVKVFLTTRSFFGLKSRENGFPSQKPCLFIEFAWFAGFLSIPSSGKNQLTAGAVVLLVFGATIRRLQAKSARRRALGDSNHRLPKVRRNPSESHLAIL